MTKRLLQNLSSRRGGVNRLVLIFILAIIAMLVLIAIPAVHAFRLDADRSACEAALKSASDGLTIEFMDSFTKGTVAEAQKTLDEVMPGRDNICPTGGTVYLIADANGVYKPVCGIHDRDEKQRTRLNASYAKELLGNELKALKKQDQEIPDTVSIMINGKELACERAEELPAILSGTSASVEFEGIVAFFTADDRGNLKNFLYADEAYYAKCVRGGWSGDAFS